MPPPRPRGAGYNSGLASARSCPNTPMSERQQMALLIQMTATSTTEAPRSHNKKKNNDDHKKTEVAEAEEVHHNDAKDAGDGKEKASSVDSHSENKKDAKSDHAHSSEASTSNLSKRNFSDLEEEATDECDEVKKKKRKDSDNSDTTTKTKSGSNSRMPARAEKNVKQAATAKNSPAASKTNTTAADKEQNENAKAKQTFETNDTEEDDFKMSDVYNGGLKVPPLKIVIPQQNCAIDTDGNVSRTGKVNTSRSAALPYVVSSNNDSNDRDVGTQCSPHESPVKVNSSAVGTVIDEKNMKLINEEKNLHRVLRSSHRTTAAERNSNNSSPQMQSNSPSPASSNANEGNDSNKTYSNTATSPVQPNQAYDHDNVNLPSPSTSSTSSSKEVHTSTELHPRKRKIRSKNDDSQKAANSTSANANNSNSNSNNNSSGGGNNSTSANNSNTGGSGGSGGSGSGGGGSGAGGGSGSGGSGGGGSGSGGGGGSGSGGGGGAGSGSGGSSGSGSGGTSSSSSGSNSNNNSNNNNNNNNSNNNNNGDGSTAAVESHPHDFPFTNCFQMYLNIRRQIEKKWKNLYPIKPRPPQGYSDYLINKRTYLLTDLRKEPPSIRIPDSISKKMRDIYLIQQKERDELCQRHIVEREKLCLNVEQEIIRVHSKAARNISCQTAPYSVCTFLKDEEVYNIITPEQEEKDKGARHRFNGRLLLSWLQDVDDKWEKIKESMVLRHHNEAESLHAVQIMDWEIALKKYQLCDFKSQITVEKEHVPIVHVSDDFDLLPA